MTVERVGISFDSDLLDKFDKLINKKGYSNRSKAIRDLVRKSLIEEEIETESGEVIGTLTIIYNHNTGDIIKRLLHLQHYHHSAITSTIHIHIDKHACLEILVVRGKAQIVRTLADNIKAIKGVKHGQLVITKTSF